MSGYIYFLIEHKSGRDRFSSLQMLKYMVQIWDSYIKNSKRVKKLPVIIPCLFLSAVLSYILGAQKQLGVDELIDLTEDVLSKEEGETP